MEARIWNYSGWVETETFDNKKIKEYYDTLLLKSEFNILSYIDHTFEPHGYTGLWLLSESHFAIHTFPEECKYYIELSSCIEDKYDNFLRNGKLD